jgi:hypothetical protein
VSALDSDKAIFGDAAEDVATTRAQNPPPEDLAKWVFTMYGGQSSLPLTPGADLFRRRRFSDLLSVLMPGVADGYRYDFVTACLKHEVAETNNEVCLYELIDHAMQDDALNEIAQLAEERRFSELIDKLCPKADKTTRDRLTCQLRDAMLDPDKLAEELDKDIARGAVSAGEAVEQIIHGLYLSSQDFFAAAGADALQRLLPNIPKDFMADCARALRIKLTELQREVVHTVTEKVMIPPPPPADEVIEAKVWENARSFVEKIANLAKPLTSVGLNSETVMQTVWQAISQARESAQRDHHTPDFPSMPTDLKPGLSSFFGTTILGSDEY